MDQKVFNESMLLLILGILVFVKFRLSVEALCSSCHLGNETATHLFCASSQTSWSDLNIFLNRKSDLYFKLKIEIFLFGQFDDEIPVKKMHVLNFIALLVKFQIHAKPETQPSCL